jgi:DNA-binding response OmpR family regulator
VLLIDDDPIILELNCMILKYDGYDVTTFQNPRSALKNTSACDFDVSVIDYMMPDIRGDHLALELRKINPQLGIIFLSGYINVLKIVEGLMLDNCRVLLKPVAPQRLVQEIDSMMLSQAIPAR